MPSRSDTSRAKHLHRAGRTDTLIPAAPPEEHQPLGPTLEQAIGLQVRQLRRQAGVTVSELAAAASLSGGMLSKIENGQISPSLASLKALAAALNVPLTNLFAAYDEKQG